MHEPYNTGSLQVYEGVWVENVPKCGEMRDLNRENAPLPTEYPIPTLELAQPATVIGEAVQTFMSED